MIKRRPLHQLLFLIVGLALVFAPLGAAQPAAAKTGLYRYAGGLQFQAGEMIRVFKINTIQVDSDVTLSIANGAFTGIYDPENLKFEQDEYNRHERFTGFNQNTETILEQFGATGGFYAYQPQLAFGQELLKNAELNPRNAQIQACSFLQDNRDTLFPKDQMSHLTIPGLDQPCDVKLPYRFSTETLSNQENKPGAETINTPIRLLATIPISVTTGNNQYPTLPMAGPGGHISMIFSDTNPDSQAPTLDQSARGLQAVAMPAFGRSLEPLPEVPLADPGVAVKQVTEMVRASYPGGTDINVPLPTLAYYMTDAAEPQTLLEPKLFFEGVSVVVDGETIFFRDIILPGVLSGEGGLGPAVTILSPSSGAIAFPGSPVSLKGSVTGGTAPYAYEWQIESGAVITGTLSGPGDLPTAEVPVPGLDSKGSPGSLSVRLTVTDNDGATREAMVSLLTPVSLFLPYTTNTAAGASSAAAALSLAETQAPEAINYRFGVEYGSDYPPYGAGGSDLGGVPPDANGFSSGMFGQNWPRVFNWYNANAWEKDWRDCSLGGLDCSWGVDRADFVYYAGHGAAGGISLPSNSHDSSWFDGSQARYQNARWVGFASCQTLRVQGFPAGSEPIRRWFNAFRGAHLLMGFNSNMSDVAFGPRFVDNMRIPTVLFFEMPWAQRTIAEAWVQTAFQMNAGKPAYLWATSSSVNPIGNKLPKVGDPLMSRPTPVNWYYWVWWNE